VIPSKAGHPTGFFASGDAGNCGIIKDILEFMPGRHHVAGRTSFQVKEHPVFRRSHKEETPFFER